MQLIIMNDLLSSENILISSQRVCNGGGGVEFSMQTIMTSTNKGSFISSFLICMTFIYFFLDLWSGYHKLSTMLSKSGESGHPCLVSDFRGKAASLSRLSLKLAVGFS